jgi:hypothetical protein
VRVGLLWRAEWDPFESGASSVQRSKLHGVFAAFTAFGVHAEPVVYSDETIDEVRARLLELDGVLVWVNPIEQGRDRSKLDPLLREAAASGVWVSAHPDVILKLATKKVLVESKHMDWGTDTRLYRTIDELRLGLPARLLEGGPVVLKQLRGMGGDGVWKIELDGRSSSVDDRAHVWVQHAAAATPPQRVLLMEFLRRCELYFDRAGSMVEQPFQPRLPEGMIRAYLTHDKVVGFTRQYPRGLMPPAAEDRPTGKVFEPASEPTYGELRSRLETDWIPELQEILGIGVHSLPVIWDTDFLYGPKNPDGADTYVLCEINASSTFAFPEFAMPVVAQAALARIEERIADS